MSTRATIHFHTDGDKNPDAIIYRHGDGYPDGLGLDLQTFFAEVKSNVEDTRFNNGSYLAAKWVVWDARQMSQYSKQDTKHPLAFLSVGIVQIDPGDIEYRYHVWCSAAGKSPKITCEKVDFETRKGSPVSIPDYTP